MKKRMIYVLLLYVCCLMGCTKSTIVKPDAPEYETVYEEPDMIWMNNTVLDMEQLRLDVKELALDQSEYPMASKVEFTIDQENEYVTLDIVVKDDTDNDKLGWYIGEVIKIINDCAVTQDFGYACSEEHYFGGLYQEKPIDVRVFYESQYPDGQPLLQDTVAPDTYQEFIIKN